ncbi:hypothetical protein [Plastoroseomonas hellenica]|uniref:hypothetical protein n=1 Tax=Plastoroseomonas hellenica TaxID=2687306 RepID=UPI001BA6FBD9|nr:hypothetical protein [Plastoroseomonas hellenica]MBR0647283.1 hypothetical protein [Plastoroseomonas hellenica]
MMAAEPVLHWSQLPAGAPLGVVRQVAQRNALVAVASRAVGDRVEAAALIAIGEFLAATRDARSIEIPKTPRARQEVLEPAMLHPAAIVAAAVVLLWQAVMAERRDEWEADTAAILAQWSAPAAALPRPARRRRAGQA